MSGPRIVATPPMTRPAMNSIERCRPKLSGPMVVAARAKQPPPTEVTNALRRERQHLVLGRVHARDRGADLVVPHGDEAPPHAAAHEVGREEEHDDRDDDDRGQDPVVVRPAVRHPGRRVPPEPSRRRDLPARDRLAVAATGQAGEVDAEEVVRLGDGGEGQRQTQRDQREVQAADLQRRNADHETDDEADGARRSGSVARNGQPWSATRIMVV